MHFSSTQNLTTRQVVERAIFISIVAFFVWVALTAVIWFALHLFGADFDFWPMLEALSAALAVAQVFGGGAVALWQLRDSADSRNLGIYNDIFERLMSDESIESRRWIYVNLSEDPRSGIDGLSEAGQRHVKSILNSLDHLGFLLEQDWITGEGEDAIIKWVSPFVVKCWARLEPYVEFEAERRHEPDYYDAVRKLAERCIEWRRINLPGARITWVGGRSL